MLDASDINEIKVVKKTGPCYKCIRPHFQCECKHNGNNKFQNKPTIQQRQKCIYTDKFHNNNTSNHMFPVGTLSFQASQSIRSGKDTSVIFNAIKCFLDKLRRSIASKRSQKLSMTVHLQQKSVNEVIQGMMTW